jgi:hypothetical protein
MDTLTSFSRNMGPEAINSLAVRQWLTEAEREIGGIVGGSGKASFILAGISFLLLHGVEPP